jgi:hypothetical protein
MYGLSVEAAAAMPAATTHDVASTRSERGFLRAIYHAPANADIRLHLLVGALATGWLTAELVAVALYYNLRWIARYALVAHRLNASAGGA